MKRVYPLHIYETIRREAAVSYVRHELRKYLPSLRDKKAWSKIDGDIVSWFEAAPFLYPVRDFWNGVHGIMMGFKLYIRLLDFITAENVNWNKEEIGLEELTFGVLNETVAKRSKDMGVKQVQVAYEDLDKKERLADLEEVTAFYNLGEEREGHPIIVTQKRIDGEDKLVVYDGNGRTTKALLEERKTILAYVGRFEGEERRPRNYWLSTSFLMELSYFARDAWRTADETGYEHYMGVLRHILKESQSETGLYELKNRAMPDVDFLKILLKNL